MARKRRSQAANSNEQDAPQQAVIPQKRTTAEINFSVLSKYVSGLHSIIDIAPFTVLYTFSTETRQWEKCGIEGSLFVCQTWRDDYQGFSVVILNRKSLNNFIIDITGTNQVELTEQYVILQGVEDGAPQIYGVWIFSEEGSEPSTKDRVGDIIQRCAVAVEDEEELVAEDSEHEEEPDLEPEQYTAPVQQHGQPLDLNSLFQPPQVQQQPYITAQQAPQAAHQLDLLKLFGPPQVQLGQHAPRHVPQIPQQYVAQPPYPQMQQYGSPAPQHHTQAAMAPLGSSQHQLLDLFRNGNTG